jgi:malonate-semialdehyde dehydrogenase (acetylating)/methylmalonate-semialdehyde dehydrogenase
MEKIRNYINGEWRDPSVAEYFDVVNPATGELIARTPMCGADTVREAAQAAADALPAWRRTPAQDRIGYLFKLRDLLRANLDEISRTITNEAGKTYDESKGEMVRAIENVEVACGIPMMMKGEIAEDIAPGIDEIMIRQPVGVVATICPFNFPGMIPFWYLPYAIACGNTYIVKPSEKVPMTMQLIFKLIDQLGLPKGVINMVNGAREVVDGILDHPSIRAITFVGSSAVARYIYHRAAENGKRVQAQGGAKNPVVIMPDADKENGHPHRRRLGLWLCRAALPGRLVGRDGRRSAQPVYGNDLRCGTKPRGRLRARQRRTDGTGDQPGIERAHRGVDRVGRQRGRDHNSRRAQ